MYQVGFQRTARKWRFLGLFTWVLTRHLGRAVKTDSRSKDRHLNAKISIVLGQCVTDVTVKTPVNKIDQPYRRYESPIFVQELVNSSRLGNLTIAT